MTREEIAAARAQILEVKRTMPRMIPEYYALQSAQAQLRLAQAFLVEAQLAFDSVGLPASPVPDAHPPRERSDQWLLDEEARLDAAEAPAAPAAPARVVPA